MSVAAKTVLITGATGGLGEEVTRCLAEQYRIVGTYRREEEWSKLRQTLRGDATGIRVDLTDESSVGEAVAKAGPLYGLVHLAGGFEAGRIQETKTDTWERMIALNLTSAFLVIRAAIPHLERGGRIVAISSGATERPSGGTAAYTVTKSALNTFIEVLAVELKDRGITANAILPSALDTPAMRQEMDRSKLIPLERVAGTILYLLSDAAANVTGSRIVLTV